MKVRLAGICPESLVNGEGLRRVFFFQGCKHNCKGCFNQETHTLNGGNIYDINSLVDDILKCTYLDGVTFSGGDPFEQAKSIVPMAKILTENNISIWIYTGYTYEEIIKDNDKLELLQLCDVLIDGQFKEDLKDKRLRFRGSTNQRVIDIADSLLTGCIVSYKDYYKDTLE